MFQKFLYFYTDCSYSSQYFDIIFRQLIFENKVDFFPSMSVLLDVIKIGFKTLCQMKELKLLYYSIRIREALIE